MNSKISLSPFFPLPSKNRRGLLTICGDPVPDSALLLLNGIRLARQDRRRRSFSRSLVVNRRVRDQEVQQVEAEHVQVVLRRNEPAVVSASIWPLSPAPNKRRDESPTGLTTM